MNKNQIIFEQVVASDRNIVLWLHNGRLLGVNYWQGLEPKFDQAEMRNAQIDFPLSRYVAKVLNEEQREFEILPHPDYEETLSAIDRAITAYVKEEEKRNQLTRHAINDGCKTIIQEALRTLREKMEKEDPDSFTSSVLIHDIKGLERAFDYMADIVLTVGELDEWLEEKAPIPSFMLNSLR